MSIIEIITLSFTGCLVVEKCIMCLYNNIFLEKTIKEVFEFDESMNRAIRIENK